MFARFSGKKILRSYSTCYRTIKNPELQSLKKGTGGRSSFNGKVATVFGASGFVGRSLINRLGKIGTQIIIPYRREPSDRKVKNLKLAGDLGQVLFQEFDLRNPHSIYKAVKHSNVVINLIGKRFETRNFSFRDVNVTGARNIARACREMGVERLVHVSDLNVTHHPKKYMARKPLDFLPTKLDGECAVFEEFPCATVIRPAAIFGFEDKLLWPLNQRVRRSSFGQSLPIYKKGEATVKQPVFVSDVAQGIVNAIFDIDTKGKIYQAIGPKRYLLSEIYDWCSRVTEREKYEQHYRHDARFDPILRLTMYVLVKFSVYERKNWLHPEHLELESVTDTVDGKLPTLEDLNVKLQPIDIMYYQIYHTFLWHAYYLRKSYSKASPPVEVPLKNLWNC